MLKNAENILVITNFNYRCMGGIENYNRILYSNFSNIHFHELPLLKSDVIVSNELNNVFILENTFDFGYVNSKYSKNLLNKIIFFLKRKIETNKIAKKLNKYIKENKISKILFSGDYFYNKKFIKKHSNKIYFIQHMNPFHYLEKYKFSNIDFKYIKRNFIERIVYLFISNRNFIKLCKNIVVFTQEDENLFKKEVKNKKANWIKIPLPSKYLVSFDNSIEKIYDFAIIGRLVKSKNISSIANFAVSHKNYKFVVCGEGNEKTKLENLENVEIYSALNKEKLLEIYKKTKYLLSFSYLEGFPFIVAEALSQGVPCILFNAYPSAMFLIGQNERGLLLNPSNYNYQKDIIDYIKTSNYNLISEKCTIFAKQYLSESFFIEKWKEIFIK